MDYLKYYDVDYNSLKSTSTSKAIKQYEFDANVIFCAELSFFIIVPIILLFISHHLYQIVKELKNVRESSSRDSKEITPEDWENS